MSERMKSVLFPLGLFVLLLLLWQAAVQYWGVPKYVLPPPREVALALHKGYVEGAYWGDLAFTLSCLLGGYLFGCGAAFVLGVLFAEFRWLERLLTPFVLGLQSMPKVALAPLLLVWLGFGAASKVVMVGLVCFFPMFINTVAGMKATDPALLDLMRAFSASRWRVLLTIKLPSAAGHIFAGLQISIVLGLIGAIVAEFVSSTKGLGFLINAATTTLDTSTMFAALVSLAVLGILGSHAVRALHRKVVFWDRRSSTTPVSE